MAIRRRTLAEIAPGMRIRSCAVGDVEAFEGFVVKRRLGGAESVENAGIWAEAAILVQADDGNQWYRSVNELEFI